MKSRVVLEDGMCGGIYLETTDSPMAEGQAEVVQGEGSGSRSGDFVGKRECDFVKGEGVFSCRIYVYIYY